MSKCSHVGVLSFVFALALSAVPTAAEARTKTSSRQHHHHDHSHVHGPGCGHTPIYHDGHVDYLHDGHLHHVTRQGKVEEHAISVSKTNPAGHTGRAAAPPSSGAPRVRHGDHYDYLVNGRLSHKHGKHYDDHGPVQVAGQRRQSAHSHPAPHMGHAGHSGHAGHAGMMGDPCFQPCCVPCAPVCQ